MKRRLSACILGAALLLFSPRQILAAILLSPGTVYATAGNGTSGYSGDNGPALNATLNWPVSVAVNPVDQSLLIADTQNNCIRRIDAGGTITTIAGKGPEAAGYSGDNGPATEAQLYGPLGVTADSEGTIYIADAGNFVIRKIDTAGKITTYAGGGSLDASGGVANGGPATSVSLSIPFGLAADKDGNLYVSDRGYNTIWCIQKQSGAIFAVAGDQVGNSSATQAAKLVFPAGLAIFENHLYVADTGNHVVKVVGLNSGEIGTVAGGGNATTGRGDGGPAVDAQLALPSGVAVDQNGILYISDASDGVIRRVDNSGIITSVVGQYGVLYAPTQKSSALSTSLSAPSGITMTEDGALFVADAGNSEIRQLRPDQGWLPFSSDMTLPLTVLNASTGATTFTLSSISGTNAGDFYVTGNTCAGSPLIGGAQCVINIGYTASSSSPEIAGATLTTPTSTQSIMLTGGPSAETLPMAALEFIPMTPCRVVDTRRPNAQLGGPVISAQVSRDFPLLNGDCPIPPTAAAYSLNLTVAPHGSLGYITMWPTGSPQPYVSTINSVDGRTKAVATIVPAGANGGVSLYAYNTTDVILDINGYFVPRGAAGGLAFHPVAPCRLADTRNVAGPLGGPALSRGETRDLPLLAGPCSLPSTAKAYSLNFTVVPSAPLPYLTVWPAGEPEPYTSVLNDFIGQTVANANLAPAGVAGDISVFSYASTNLVIDVNGYFAPSDGAGLSYYNVAPCRVIDTRTSGGAPITSLTVDIAGSACDVPAAAAYAVNLTVVPIGALGYVTLWPWGEPRPYVSTLNASDGIITSNLAIVPAIQGKISAFASGPTQLIIDVLGFFK